MADDFLTTQVKSIRERIDELDRIIGSVDDARAERATLAQALGALTGESASESSPRKSRASKPRSGGGKSSGKRAPRGQNQEKVLAVVGDRPGVLPGEVAQATGIGQAVVYNVLKTLTQKGRIEKTSLGGDRYGYRLKSGEAPSGDNGDQEPAAA